MGKALRSTSLPLRAVDEVPQFFDDLRHAGFARLARAVKQGGLCVVLDEASNIAGLLAQLPIGWAKIWQPKAGFALRRV